MAISMSPRENYLACMNHKPHQYTPGIIDVVVVGRIVPFERGEGGSGVDGFGVRWVAPISGGFSSAIPAPNEFLLTDITKWRNVINFPDPNGFDWEKLAATELANANRDTQVIEVSNRNYIFERLAALMGFEGALLAMALEPEATFELLEALTDWKIKVIKNYARYYKPDIFTFQDDVATERNLFMSPETYRTLIKPLHKRTADVCLELGIIPVQHTCGKADLIAEDMIDEGMAAWSAVQSTNNIERIIENHGDKFVIIGGYNTTGEPGMENAPEEVARAEVRRCVEVYGRYGCGFIFSGLVVKTLDVDNPMDLGHMNRAIFDEFAKIRAEQTA